MAHDCIDWTTRPPTRKIPLFILTRGDDRVYTIVPQDFKTLQDIARREFDLGDVDIKISSSCINLCDGRPARLTEASWEHIYTFIGCATVEVVAPRSMEDRVRQEQPPRAENVPDVVAEKEHFQDADESDHQPGAILVLNAPAAEITQGEEHVPPRHEEDNDRPATPESQSGEPVGEEASAMLPRKPRRQRRVASEDEDEDEDESEQEYQAPAASIVASPPKPAIEIKKERASDYRQQSEWQPAQPSIEIKKERTSDYRPESQRQPPEGPDKPIKQEKREAWSAKSASRSQAQFQSEARPLTESGDSNTKLMIRVAHRPSKQESKFTTKGTTRVHKVLAGACKSFGLDAGRATLYLIVLMEDEDGQVENLFPCDKNDTIARAGAERNTESRFLLKIAGEA